MNKTIVILGSSRSFGNTKKAVIQILGDEIVPIIDLNSLEIKPYDYEYKNKNDDYIKLMELVVNYEVIILATPIYWYCMSATMKIFIDRLSDLLDIRKDLGRLLRGKRLFVISSFSTSLPRAFEDPFEQTCNYMGIKYEGCSFIYFGQDEKLLNNNQGEIIKAKKTIFS